MVLIDYCSDTLTIGVGRAERIICDVGTAGVFYKKIVAVKLYPSV